MLLISISNILERARDNRASMYVMKETVPIMLRTRMVWITVFCVLILCVLPSSCVLCNVSDCYYLICVLCGNAACVY